MRYRWDDFQLDRAGGLLTLHGRQIDVSRKVMTCIDFLIEARHRVVPYDELIRAVWGHDNVSHHQLAQLVLTARRAINDDGQSQHSIRTLPGIGYRWVGALILEDKQAPVSPPTAAREAPAAAPQPPLSSPAPAPAALAAPAPAQPILGDTAKQTRRTAKPSPQMLAALGLATTALAVSIAMRNTDTHLGGTGATAGVAASQPPQSRPVRPGNGPIAGLREALFLGRFEEVREGLASLPPDLADSADARLIEIELDIRRGRFARAKTKIQAQLDRALASGDSVWQARVLCQRSELHNRQQLSGADVLAPAQAAVALLEAQREPPADVLADALWRRSQGYTLSDRLDAAQRDLMRARDLYRSIGDTYRSTEMRGSLARVWMRSGRLSEALEEMRQVADHFDRFDDQVREIFARNTMTKIQIELLRWDQALASNDRSMELLRGVPDSERRYPTLQLRALVLTGQGRLREASSLLEEAAALTSERTDFVIPAMHYLEAGRAQDALAAAGREFDSTRIDTRSNLLLENKDGALLLWTMAAQKIVDAGQPLPQPSAKQLQGIEQAQTAVTLLARGRWRWMQQRHAEAEQDMRKAFESFRAERQLYRMTLAAEPLLTALLRRGETAGARRLLSELRAQDPERIDLDYRGALMRLRIAHAERHPQNIASAYRNAAAIAGERSLPPLKILIPTQTAQPAKTPQGIDDIDSLGRIAN